MMLEEYPFCDLHRNEALAQVCISGASQVGEVD